MADNSGKKTDKHGKLPMQLELNLKIEKQVQRDGVDMGVLSDGRAFLSGRGLARLCGVDSSRISEINAEWNAPTPKPRIAKIRSILQSHGLDTPSPVVGGVKTETAMMNAWPEDVSLAVLEFYAFDAGENDIARRNYRLLAGKGLHDLIYKEVGYDPSHQIPENWRVFHDRVSLTYDAIPAGYFGIFKEVADIVVHLGQNGLHIDSQFVPDISIGICWGKYWNDQGLDKKYGERIKFEHNYPEYFPQAKANPQLPWCYPEMALGEFRKWLRENYIGEGKFANYLMGVVKKKELPVSFAQLAIASYEKPLAIA